MSDDTITIKLRKPVQFGKHGEPVTDIELKPNGRALRDLEVSMGGSDGKLMMNVKPYELTRIGLRMAGIDGDKAFVDMMDARDIWEVGQAVVGFLVSGSESTTDGSTPSP